MKKIISLWVVLFLCVGCRLITVEKLQKDCSEKRVLILFFDFLPIGLGKIKGCAGQGADF